MLHGQNIAVIDFSIRGSSMDVSDKEAVRFGDNGSKTVYDSEHEGIVKEYKNLRAHLHVNSYHTHIHPLTVSPHVCLL